MEGRDERLEYKPNRVKQIGVVVAIAVLVGAGVAGAMYYMSLQEAEQEQADSSDDGSKDTEQAEAESTPEEKTPKKPAAGAPVAAKPVGPRPESLALPQLADSEAIQWSIRPAGKSGFRLQASTRLKGASTIQMADCLALLSHGQLGLVRIATAKIPEADRKLTVSPNKPASYTLKLEWLELVGFHLTAAEKQRLIQQQQAARRAQQQPAAGAPGEPGMEGAPAEAPPDAGMGGMEGMQVKVPNPLGLLPGSITVVELGPAVTVKKPQASGGGQGEMMSPDAAMMGAEPGMEGMGGGGGDYKTKVAQAYFTWRKTSFASQWGGIRSQVNSQPKEALETLEKQFVEAAKQTDATKASMGTLAGAAANPYVRAEIQLRLRQTLRALAKQAVAQLESNTRRAGSMNTAVVKKAWDVFQGAGRPTLLGADWQSRVGRTLAGRVAQFFSVYEQLAPDAIGASSSMSQVREVLTRGSLVVSLGAAIRPDVVNRWRRKHEDMAVKATLHVLRWARREADKGNHDAAIKTIEPILAGILGVSTSRVRQARVPDSIPEAGRLKELLTRCVRLSQAKREYEQGRSSLRSKQFAEALQHFRRAAAVTESPFADKASQEMRTISDKVDQAVKQALEQGDKLEAGQRPRAAYQAYEKAQRQYPKSNFSGLLRDRMKSLKTNILDKAGKELAQARRSLEKKDFIGCRKSLGALKAMGRDLPELQEAGELERELNEAIDKTCRSLRSKARNAQTLGQSAKANKIWKRIVELAPRSTYALEARRRLGESQ